MKVHHITIKTGRFSEEISFYQKFAGLSIIGDLRSMGKDIVYLSEEEGGTAIEICYAPEIDNAGNEGMSISFKADDIEAVRETLLEDGFEPTPIISPIPEVKFFIVKDPAGVRVQFI